MNIKPSDRYIGWVLDECSLDAHPAVSSARSLSHGAQKPEKHTKWPEATQQILWQSLGDLPGCWLALLTTSTLAKWLKLLL